MEEAWGRPEGVSRCIKRETEAGKLCFCFFYRSVHGMYY